ncbi:MAG: ATP synthase F1 subunit gamma [Oscillospiraceae bacterium]|nr:ATP synthase F1 subunit gamma [Oscillospiraceae bacterium]
MPSKKVLKRRLTSVRSTQKIIKAMNMVAAAKLQKDKSRLTAARPFFIEAQKIINVIKNREDVAESIFLKPREVRSTAYLIITGDRGLCGGYNANLCEKALAHMNDGKNEKLIVVGLKGIDYFRRHGKNILGRYDGVLETAFYEEDVKRMMRDIINLYVSGEVDEIYVAYTQFESVLNHVPSVEKLLPISRDRDAFSNPDDMRYEQDTDFFLSRAVRLYIGAFIYTALLESSSCEQAARMLSMDTAANNASEIQTKLTRVYNRGRQAAITREISEVVAAQQIGS